MEPVIRKLTMHTYKTQVALRERMIDRLAKEFEGETLTTEQKSDLAHQWDKALKEKHAFQFMLDLLERQEKAER